MSDAAVTPLVSADRSSIEMAPVFAAIVPTPTPVVAVIPMRSRGTWMFMSSVLQAGEYPRYGVCPRNVKDSLDFIVEGVQPLAIHGTVIT